ncbi:MAG: AraC family transcriptional regulator [Bacteroidota bacterium]|nr:AraC family transcriptional regulator [Bacteroidota bacterium]
MRPSFESVNTSENTSFLVRKFEEKNFSAPYHFHPELELTLILKGCGKRYVGSHMHDYFPGDLVLLGANLPHCWKTEDDAVENSISVVVHFNIDFLGEDFFKRPEMNTIHQLLNNSNYGLQFTAGNKIIKERILSLSDENNSFKRLIIFLDVLHDLSNARYAILDKKRSYAALSYNDKQRINEVIAYVVENFHDSISLRQAASIANMTSHAFCKYFKKLTRKTFIEAVNDYRIDFAIRQLVNTNKSISEIGFESGFNDVSNFHKTFKSRMKLSPLSYRNMFREKIG